MKVKLVHVKIHIGFYYISHVTNSSMVDPQP